MLGKPVVRGTRIPVELIIRKLSEGATEADLLDACPRLTREDIQAALAYAADTVAHEAKRNRLSPDNLAERLLAERLTAEQEAWQAQFDRLLSRVHSRMKAFDPAEIESDNTSAAAEAKAERRASHCRRHRGVSAPYPQFPNRLRSAATRRPGFSTHPDSPST